MKWKKTSGQREIGAPGEQAKRPKRSEVNLVSRLTLPGLESGNDARQNGDAAISGADTLE